MIIYEAANRDSILFNVVADEQADCFSQSEYSNVLSESMLSSSSGQDKLALKN